MRFIVQLTILLCVMFVFQTHVVASENKLTNTPLFESGGVEFKENNEVSSTKVIEVFVVLMVLLSIVFVMLMFGKKYILRLNAYSEDGVERVKINEVRKITTGLTICIVEIDGLQHVLCKSGDNVIELNKQNTLLK